MAIFLFDRLEDFVRRRDEALIKQISAARLEKAGRLFLWFQRKVYPINGARIMPAIDKIMVWPILFSIGILLYEVFSWATVAPDLGIINIYASAIFFVIFFGEFLIRFWLRGISYLKMWGWVDIPVIIADFSTVALYIYLRSNQDQVNESELVYLLRTLRLFRMFRVVRFLRLLSQGRTIKRFIRRVYPYPMAILFAIGYIVLSLIIMLSIVSFALGVSFCLLVSEILTQVWSVLSLSNMRHADPFIRVFVAFSALLIAVTIIDIFGRIFSPILDRLKARQKEVEAEALLNDHVIICLNEFDEFEGSLEEFLKVFRGYLDLDTVVMMEDGHEHQLERLANKHLRFVKGNLNSVSFWSDAFPARARAIILLGQSKIESDAYSVVVREHDMDRADKLPLFVVSNSFDAALRRDSRGDDLLEIIHTPSKFLLDHMARNTWNEGSIQYSVFKRLSTQLDNNIGFPSLPDLPENEAALSSIVSAFKAKLGSSFTIKKSGSSIRLRIEGDGDKEALEVRLIEAVEEVLGELRDEASKVNIFVYVDTLDLLKWNDIFAEDRRHHVSIFAIEMALPLAIYHELEMPGAMKIWCASEESLEAVVLRPKRSGRLYPINGVRKLLGTSYEGREIIAIQRKSEGRTKHRVFIDELSRVEVQDGDLALLF